MKNCLLYQPSSLFLVQVFTWQPDIRKDQILTDWVLKQHLKSSIIEWGKLSSLLWHLQNNETEIWSEVYLTPESVLCLPYYYCPILARNINKLFPITLIFKFMPKKYINGLEVLLICFSLQFFSGFSTKRNFICVLVLLSWKWN